METKVELRLGKELSKRELTTINYHRKKEFKSETDIIPDPNNDDWEKPYFLVKGKHGKLLSFGRLNKIIVNFRGKDYPILGIATILSIKKRKGYGRKILEEMEKYVLDHKITAIGFCDPEDTPFYEKCGLEIMSGMNRFTFPTGPKSSAPGNTIYIRGADNLIESMEKYPDEKIISYSKEW